MKIRLILLLVLLAAAFAVPLLARPVAIPEGRTLAAPNPTLAPDGGSFRAHQS